VVTGALALLEHASLVARGGLVILSLFASTLPALVLAGWRLLRPAAPAPRQHRAAVVALLRPRPAPCASALLLPAVLGLVAIAWGTGATLMLGRLVVALGAASRLRQRATLVDPSPLRDTFERLCAEVHLGGTVLAVSTEVDAPVTVGARSPAVLVPAHLLDVMPEEGLCSRPRARTRPRDTTRLRDQSRAVGL